MKVQFDLSGRDREVLVALVRQFIAHGFPVGSKVLAAQMPTPVSSATIRSVLGALEDGGFLTQPHVSAGRVPTEKAYRFYVDRVVRGARLAPATERYIDQTLRSDSDRPERLMTRASRTLSEVSRNVGLVLVPTLEEKLLEHIKFINLPDHRILVVIVSKPDVVENRVVRLEETFTQDELDQAANFLNAEFHGWSLGTIRLEVFHRLEADKILYARRLKNVATLFMWGALSQDEAGGLIVDGTAKVLDVGREGQVGAHPGSLPADSRCRSAHPDRARERRKADAPLRPGGGAPALPQPRGGRPGSRRAHAYGVRPRRGVGRVYCPIV